MVALYLTAANLDAASYSMTPKKEQWPPIYGTD